jgi:hypothetical protein
MLVKFSSRDQVPPGRNRSLQPPRRPVFPGQRAKTTGSIPGSSTEKTLVKAIGSGQYLSSPPSRVSLPSDDPSPVHLPAAAYTERSIGIWTAREE